MLCNRLLVTRFSRFNLQCTSIIGVLLCTRGIVLLQALVPTEPVHRILHITTANLPRDVFSNSDNHFPDTDRYTHHTKYGMEGFMLNRSPEIVPERSNSYHSSVEGTQSNIFGTNLCLVHKERMEGRRIVCPSQCCTKNWHDCRDNSKGYFENWRCVN